LVGELAEELAVSAGSACHSGATMISYVLQAMGVEPALARATVRLSVGRFTTEEEVDRAVELILAKAGP
jgi:cysteine desulfurase